MIASMFWSRIHFLFLVLGLIVLVILAGCRQAASEAVPTQAQPAALPTAAPATPIAALPAPTIPPTVLASTATPAPTPCAYTVLAAVATTYREDQLGCPTSAGLEATSTAYAPFEGGQMLWRADTDAIYVLNNDGGWASYPNEWREGDPAFTCGEENSPPTPVRGFGQVWCEEAGVRAALGAVTAAEIGDNASAVQDFDGGTILAAPWGSLFVLHQSGTWERVDVGE